MQTKKPKKTISDVDKKYYIFQLIDLKSKYFSDKITEYRKFQNQKENENQIEIHTFGNMKFRKQRRKNTYDLWFLYKRELAVICLRIKQNKSN